MVVSVETSLIETDYTNRCGVAASFCVAAPGGGDNQDIDGIRAADAAVIDGYTRISGTSMAAPHVSGLAAALMEKFPSLTSAQIATRIKEGASLNGLTGLSGQTLANDGEDVMRAIFGHGFINAETSSAPFASLHYAIGSDLSQAINLDEAKLDLPAGLSKATQERIRAGTFVVFDGFDGARFTAGGDTIFNSGYVAQVPIFGAAHTIDTHRGSKRHGEGYAEAAFRRDGQIDMPSKWAPRFITTGDSARLSAASSVWDKKIGLFGNLDTVRSTEAVSYGWDVNVGGVSVRPFIQIDNTDQSDDTPLRGYGAAFVADIGRGAQVVGGIKQASEFLNNGLLGDGHTLTDLTEVEYGFVTKLSSQSDLFARISTIVLEDVDAFDTHFGFQNVESNGWTVGYETRTSLGHFAVGVSKPNTLSQGDITLITPSGRSKEGALHYVEQRFPIIDDNHLERFIAYGLNNGGWDISLGLVEDRYEPGTIGASKLQLSRSF